MIHVTKENVDDMIEKYVGRVVEDMDTDTLMTLAMEYLSEDKCKYTYEQLETEIMEYYPDLLGVDE